MITVTLAWYAAIMSYTISVLICIALRKKRTMLWLPIVCALIAFVATLIMGVGK